MKAKQIVKNSSSTTNQISMSNVFHRITQGVGRNRLRKSKLIKLRNVRGAVLPSFTRLARLPTSKNLQDLVNWKAFTLIQNTWRFIRVQNIDFLIEATSYDKKKVENKIKAYLPNINITSVKKVNNPFLEALYNITKEEYETKYGTAVMEKELFHSTRENSVESIVKNNLNWRLVTRARFGQGTCFSSDADYADCHANRRNGNSRAFIICKVLVCKRMLGSQCLVVPHSGYDTTTGGKTNEIIYVKYKDNEFLPTYVAYYRGSSPYSSKYNKMPRNWF